MRILPHIVTIFSNSATWNLSRGLSVESGGSAKSSIARLLKKGFEKFRETLSGLFYFLVLMSIALIWKDGVWSINFPNQSESLEPFLGFLFGSVLIYLLHKISFIFQDT